MTDNRKTMLSRRKYLQVLSGATLGGVLAATGPAFAADAGTTPPGTVSSLFVENLLLVIAAMEEGAHGRALAPMRAVLRDGRNDPAALLALGTLYLHAGSAARAERAFARTRQLNPDDALAPWGETLALLVQNRVSRVPETAGAGETLSLYTRLLRGDTADVLEATRAVAVTENDLLRLEIAGFAALRGGDAERGEALLSALVERPEMRKLEEDRALILPFLPNVPAQGAAPALPSAIELPAPVPGTVPLSGTVSLFPPDPLPTGATAVSYTIEGAGDFAAATNVAPYFTQWNSTRYPNGDYTIHAVAQADDGRVLLEQVRSVSVFNAGAPASALLSPAERRTVNERLARLLAPRPSRKAAHFALAERAVARKDSRAALEHLECVVAIDPLYNNARESLRRYNAQTVGACPAVWCAATQEKLVALTFDDGPKPGATPALLDALAAANAKATFFVVGSQAELHPDLIERMAHDGHEIANHSFSHPNLTYLDGVAVARELCRTSAFVRQTTGTRPRFFRPPGGNASAGVTSVAEGLGLAGAYWTVDGLNWERPPFGPSDLVRQTVTRVRPGAVVLLHNAPPNTIAAVGPLVKALRERGYEIVTMTELVRRAPRVAAKPASVKHTGKE